MSIEREREFVLSNLGARHLFWANNDVELLTAGQKNQSDIHLDPKAAANASLAENLRGALETLINEEIKHEGYVMPDITTCS